MEDRNTLDMRALRIPVGPVTLDADLALPAGASGIVLFAHGSGSSRFSTRNRHVARQLNEAGLGTVLADLLTPAEEAVDQRTRQLRFDIRLLAEQRQYALPRKRLIVDDQRPDLVHATPSRDRPASAAATKGTTIVTASPPPGGSSKSNR